VLEGCLFGDCCVLADDSGVLCLCDGGKTHRLLLGFVQSNILFSSHLLYIVRNLGVAILDGDRHVRLFQAEIKESNHKAPSLVL
jgi:hypothetical protein